MVKEYIKLPKVYQHDLSLTVEGICSCNSKEYCKCEKCEKREKLRIRRESIYKNGLCYKFIRWFKLF